MQRLFRKTNRFVGVSNIEKFTRKSCAQKGETFLFRTTQGKSIFAILSNCYPAPIRSNDTSWQFYCLYTAERSASPVTEKPTKGSLRRSQARLKKKANIQLGWRKRFCELKPIASLLCLWVISDQRYQWLLLDSVREKMDLTSSKGEKRCLLGTNKSSE